MGSREGDSSRTSFTAPCPKSTKRIRSTQSATAPHSAYARRKKGDSLFLLLFLPAFVQAEQHLASRACDSAHNCLRLCRYRAICQCQQLRWCSQRGSSHHNGKLLVLGSTFASAGGHLSGQVTSFGVGNKRFVPCRPCASVFCFLFCPRLYFSFITFLRLRSPNNASRRGPECDKYKCRSFGVRDRALH